MEDDTMVGEEFDVGEEADEVGAEDEIGAPRISPRLRRRLRRWAPGFLPAMRMMVPRPARTPTRAAPAAGGSGVGVVLGLGTATFAAGATSASLDAIVQEPLRIEDLILDAQPSPAWDGGLVVVSNIRVGTRSLLAGTEALPAGAFSPSALNRPRVGRGLVISAGKTVTIDLQLVAAATLGTLSISAVLIGSAR